jgi:hypothetical protein
MYKTKDSQVKVDLLAISGHLQKAILKTKNNSIRDGYLKIYSKLKSIIDNLSDEQIQDTLINDLKEDTLTTDPDAHGMRIDVFFNPDADQSKFHPFKICLGDE